MVADSAAARAVVLLGAVLITAGCSSSTVAAGGTARPHARPPDGEVAIVVRSEPGTSNAWTVEGRAVFGEQSQPITGVLYVDTRADGTERPSFAPAEGSLPWQANDLRQLWPVPLHPLGVSPLTEDETVAGLGNTSNAAYPGLEIHRTFELVARAPDRVRYRFVVTQRAESTAPFRISNVSRREGEVTWDPQHRRVTEVTWTETSSATGDMADLTAAVGMPTDSRVEVRLRWDAARSAERSAERRDAAERVALGARTFDDWMAAHPPEREIADSLSELEASQDPFPSLSVNGVFHFSGHPERVWAAVLDRRSPELLTRFIQAAGAGVMPLRLDDATATRLRALVTEPAVAALIARRADERFRAPLRRLARAGDQADEARLSLEVLDAFRDGSTGQLLLGAGGDPDRFMRLGHAILFQATDYHPIVRALVDVLDAHPELGGLVVQWLEGITRVSLGADVAAWRAWLADHGDQPMSAWLLEALERGPAVFRIDAANGLAALPPSDEARAALVRLLGDEQPLVRLAAARTLVTWGDLQGAALLIAEVDNNDHGQAAQSLLVLSKLAPSAFGWRPDAPEGDRSEAVGRLREWLRRASQGAT